MDRVPERREQNEASDAGRAERVPEPTPALPERREQLVGQLAVGAAAQRGPPRRPWARRAAARGPVRAALMPRVASGFGLTMPREVPRARHGPEVVEDLRRADRSRRDLETSVVGSAMSPKTIAPVGHVCWHAVTISPSAIGRCSRRATISASRMRCTQYVHFSMTPRARTVTSGFIASASDVGLAGVVVEEVEAPDLVRAVVRAEPRADAAVVDHLVQPIVAVHGGVDRAHVLAGSLLAVLAEHRLDDAPAPHAGRRRSTDRSGSSASRGRGARRPCRRSGRCSRPCTRRRTRCSRCTRRDRSSFPTGAARRAGARRASPESRSGACAKSGSRRYSATRAMEHEGPAFHRRRAPARTRARASRDVRRSDGVVEPGPARVAHRVRVGADAVATVLPARPARSRARAPRRPRPSRARRRPGTSHASALARGASATSPVVDVESLRAAVAPRRARRCPT